MTNKMKTFVTLLGLVLFVSLFTASQAGCRIRLKNKMPEPQPLLLKARGSEDGNGFFVPEDANGFVTFTAGQRVLLACPGEKNWFKNLGRGTKAVNATCNTNTTFYVDSISYNFSIFACSRKPAHVARLSGNTCYDGIKRHIEIGFEVESHFFKLIDICFDDILYTTLYVNATVVSGIAGSQHGPEPKYFKPDTFYPKGITAYIPYNKRKQQQTINTILGLRPQNDTYIKPNTSSFYLAHGHLAAKADFVYVSQQNATFHLVNVAPQWQTFNVGNWKALERSVRAYAVNNRLNLDVYTGTYGILTFPNSSGVETELYLYVDKNNNKAIPIPKLFWKAVYEPRRQLGIVFVGINNPYLFGSVQEGYVLCNDVCSNISWLHWDQRNITKGYSYCCDVNGFRARVSTLPDFTVRGLLR